MTEALADCVIERHRKRLHGRARHITIDLDPSDDTTHGQQQFTFFKWMTGTSSAMRFTEHRDTPAKRATSVLG
jgi:hypothetical protein